MLSLMIMSGLFWACEKDDSSSSYDFALTDSEHKAVTEWNILVSGGNKSLSLEAPDAWTLQVEYLSGGECQRVALARAILKDAPVVVLDEATAFADPENEYQIQKVFERLMKNKTVLMIAHRLSTVQNADNIIVMNEGKIAEQGTHKELLEKRGLYAEMWADYTSSVQWRVGKEKAL